MNQVQELLRLVDVSKTAEAVERLGSLFELMIVQPGSLRAEVLRSVDDPSILLVLHGWQELADWQRFQTSAAKVAFSAGRPADLYEFVPCGMNWRSLHRERDKGGLILRREVIAAEATEVSPRRGEGVRASQTFIYDGDEAAYRGQYLRLTRRPDTDKGRTDARVIVDELYESLLRRELEDASSGTALTAGAPAREATSKR